MQELSFKSKPNVWAYFSVKVKSCYLIMMQFLQKRERKKETIILRLILIDVLTCSLEGGFMSSQTLSLVSLLLLAFFIFLVK